MIRLKYIFLSAGPAFVLSFLISIFSTGKFGTSLIRAVVFALVFACIAVVALILSDRFLQVEGEAPAVDAAVPRRSAGSQVDLIIDDESLTDEGDGPKFSVSSNMKPVDQGKIHTTQTVQPSASETAGAEVRQPSAVAPGVSAPVQDAPSGVPSGPEPSDAASLSAEAVPVEAVPAGNVTPDARKTERVAQMKEIDELPEIDSFGSSASSGPAENLVRDSDFAREGVAEDSGSFSVVDGELAKDHDTETMAKAIRTLLKREE